MERRIGGTFVDSQYIQPVLHQLALLIRNGLINTDRVEITRQDHVANRGTDAVLKMQTAADVANMLFDVPDGFTAAAAAAKEGQVVAVALRMVAGHQTEQGRFPGAVGTDDLPVLTGVNRPAQALDDRPVVV